MRPLRILKLLPLICALGLFHPALAVSILVDYSRDTTNLFANNSVARAALEQAAADLSALLPDGQLGAWTKDSFTGHDGFYFAEISYAMSVAEPNGSGDFPLRAHEANLGADEVKVYVGWQTLTGNTLGAAVVSGIRWSGKYTDPTTQAAVEAMRVAADEEMTRGGGPVIFDNLSYDTHTFGVKTSLMTGVFLGSAWFDDDTDWHYDHTTPVVPGKADFYSVALHELMHAIGYHAHLPEGTLSTRIHDGQPQEAAIDPTLLTGTRKYLTQADRIALESIGWITVPEPRSGLLAVGALLFPLARRRRQS